MCVCLSLGASEIVKSFFVACTAKSPSKSTVVIVVVDLDLIMVCCFPIGK